MGKKDMTICYRYRNLVLCRVPNDLPSVFSGAKQKTLGKKHSAKKRFAECFIFDIFFAESFLDTSQRASLESIFSTLGKDNLKITF
jgi:hypothetical protein